MQWHSIIFLINQCNNLRWPSTGLWCRGRHNSYQKNKHDSNRNWVEAQNLVAVIIQQEYPPCCQLNKTHRIGEKERLLSWQRWSCTSSKTKSCLSIIVRVTAPTAIYSTHHVTLYTLNHWCILGLVWWVVMWMTPETFSDTSLYSCRPVHLFVRGVPEIKTGMERKSIKKLVPLYFTSHNYYYYLVFSSTLKEFQDQWTYLSPGSRCRSHCRRSSACWSWHVKPWSAVVSVCLVWWYPHPPRGCSAGWLDPPSPLQGNICVQYDAKFSVI